MTEGKNNFTNISSEVVYTIIEDFYNFSKNIYIAIFISRNNLMLEFHVVWSNARTHSSPKLQ